MKKDHLVKPWFIEKKKMFFVIFWLFEGFCYFFEFLNFEKNKSVSNSWWRWTTTRISNLR